MKYDIRDISLAPYGHQKREWVRDHMPLLRSLEEEFKKTKPFEGVKISLSVHLEAKTAYLCKVLAAGGAQMSITGSNILSTQDDVCAALVEDGLSVFAYHDATMEEYERHIEMCLECKPNIIIDDGWKDGNILKYKADCDIPEICRYAASKGVDVIIWLMWKDCMQYMKQAFPLYKSWGVKGLKIDFINANDQYVMSSLRRITQTAADNHLAVDYHGMQLKGLQVTYPNILSCEGVRGLEQCKWQQGKNGTLDGNMPGYDAMIPYIRQIIAPMDYTPGAMRNATKYAYHPVNDKPMSQGTRTHQMGMYIVYDSPLQMLSDTPDQYEKNQQCTDFIAKVPTVFDEAKTLQGEVGKYIVGARRKGSTWYVGALNNWDGRDITLPLSFLGSGRYKAVIVADGVNANRNAEDYKRTEQEVDASSTLRISMKNGGGWAARFEKL